MIEEVSRQWKTIKGIMEGTAKPDYARCVAISTRAAQKELLVPAAITVLSPIVIGLSLGAQALGGFLAGTIISGLLLAFFMGQR